MNFTDDLDLLQAQVDHEVQRLVSAIEAELRELRLARDELNARIRELVRRRLVYAGRSGDRETLRRTAGPSPMPSKPTAVLAFLEEHRGRPFRLLEIRDGLVEREWMGTDKRDRHALEVAVLALTRRGEITRVGHGVYTLEASADERHQEAA